MEEENRKQTEERMSTPDPEELQARIIRLQIENRALLLASELGLEVRTVPYVLKLADLSAAVEDGRVSDDGLKEAIGRVLEDLPQLKAKTEESGAAGFRIGAVRESADLGVGRSGAQLPMREAIAAKLGNY